MTRRSLALLCFTCAATVGLIWFLLRPGPATASHSRAAATAAAAVPPNVRAPASIQPAPAPPSPPLTPPQQPANEDDFLSELSRLNKTDKPRALAWATAGDGWYTATGVRAEARQAMKITLLVDLDRMDDARVLVRQFLAEHPESRYLPLVQGMTGIHPRPGRPSTP